MNECYKCRTKINGLDVYGLHEKCFLAWFNVQNVLEFHDLDPKGSSTKTQSKEIKKKADTFLHGRYLKYSARLGTVEYILKIKEDEFPELPSVEFVCNGIAEILGIDVAPYHLINFNGRITFVTRNFMQDYVGTLHHIYKFLPEGEENHNCEEISRIILEQTGKLADVARFIEICLFDSLIGNHDRHGRNLGIIETSKTKKLSPMYDNPSLFGTEQDFILTAHFNPSGCVWTSTSKEPKPKEYIEEFSRLGHKKVVSSFCARVVSRFPKIVELIDSSVLSHNRKKAFIKLLEQRIGDFENGK